MTRPLPILYVANAAKIGGGNRVLMDIVSGLNRERFTPLIVTPGPGPLADWANDHRIDVEVIPDGDWLGRTGLLRRAASFVRLGRARGVGLVHAMAPTCYRAAGLAGRFLRIPRVCHLGFPPEPGELARSFRFGPEVVVPCYEGQSRDVMADVRAARPGCRIVAIPNGIDTRVYRPAPVNWDTHRQLRGRASHVVLITGHLSDVKGYPTFLRAAQRIAQQLPECIFLALGGETTGVGPLARYQQLAADLGIADRVRFLGFRSDVADVLRAADLVVLPSLDEGLPLAILEAMACAKPVVATPVGGVPEAVVDEVTGLLVPPNDPQRLASAVLCVLNDRHVALRMGNAALARVQAQFSVPRLVTAVEALYTEVLGRRCDDDFVAVEQTRAPAPQTVAPTVLQS
jgi:glycosyltransferase involved in cell wall biosynthesis